MTTIETIKALSERDKTLVLILLSILDEDSVKKAIETVKE